MNMRESLASLWHGIAGKADAAAESDIARATTSDVSLDFLDPRRVVIKGGLVVLAFVVVFFGWAAFAPLDSALISPGTLVVESHRKPIQPSRPPPLASRAPPPQAGEESTTGRRPVHAAPLK